MTFNPTLEISNYQKIARIYASLRYKSVASINSIMQPSGTLSLGCFPNRGNNYGERERKRERERERERSGIFSNAHVGISIPSITLAKPGILASAIYFRNTHTRLY